MNEDPVRDPWDETLPAAPADQTVFEVSGALAGQRLDKAAGQCVGDISRTRLQSLIRGGCVRIGGIVITNPKHSVQAGDTVEIDLPPPEDPFPQPQDITLDIVYEDPELLVVNKPAGMVVHPAPGHARDTLVNALLHHCGDQLSGIGGVRRPGLIHRLDKDTSGLMVVAKTDRAHQGLSAALEAREIKRIYHTLVCGVPVPAAAAIDQPIGRHRGSRVKMAIDTSRGRPARTHYKLLEVFGDRLALLECALDTGRTHQIRVHMQFIKTPVINDPLYGPQPTQLEKALIPFTTRNEIRNMLETGLPGQMLHARRLAFPHPVSGKQIRLEAAVPHVFEEVLSDLREEK